MEYEPMKKIIHQSVFEKWQIEDKTVQSVITSPPYFALRKYSIPDVIIGNQDCEHEWGERISPRGQSGWETFEHKYDSPGSHKTTIGSKMKKVQTSKIEGHGNFCIHCNAWKGQYGLEPDYLQYIEHTVLWAREAYRVLKDDGIMFLNIADTYAGSWGAMSHDLNGKAKSTGYNTRAPQSYPARGIKPKCQLLIPHRVAIALINDNWILRDTIIWHKPNGMPESVADRFSKKFEYIFMFSKQQKYYFDLDAVREKHTSTAKYGDKVTTKSKAQGMKEYSAQVRNNHFFHNCYNPNGKNPGNLWSINTQPSPEKHYAMWPVKLAERMILCSTKENDLVCDPFAGSGTTLRVAEQHRRQAVGIDLGYTEIQERRLTENQINLL